MPPSSLNVIDQIKISKNIHLSKANVVLGDQYSGLVHCTEESTSISN